MRKHAGSSKIMKRIIFLDIDGVVNHDNWYYEQRVVNKNWECGDADPKCIALLNSLYDIGAEVVISSSWGEDADKLLNETGLMLHIIGHTDHYHSDFICRGNEIEKWIVEHTDSRLGTKFGKEYKNKDYTYVIFDDDCDMLLGQKDNFIRIDSKTGLTQEDIDNARKILLDE
jgi:hypothetical protein